MAIRIHLTLCGLLLAAAPVAAEAPAGLQPGDVGALLLEAESGDSVTFRLVMPNVRGIEPSSYDYDHVEPVALSGTVVLFDHDGPLARLESPPEFQLRFWCENDGGVQFRAEARVTVPRSQLDHAPQVAWTPERFAGFVRIYGDKPLEKTTDWRPAAAAMFSGDGDGDGTADTFALLSNSQDGEPPYPLDLLTPLGPRPLNCGEP
jgi:hypothetical protein